MKKKSVIVVILVLCLLPLLFAFHMGSALGDPPVIQGVQEKIVLYMDDDIQAALTAGVSAVNQDGKTFPVEAAICDEAGKEVPECQPGTYRLMYRCKSAETVESVLVLLPEDKQPPVITGTRDLTVTVGGTISYRDGITVTDNVDEKVLLQVDAEQVNLAQAGTYPVTYSAEDSRGNKASVTITVLVEDAPAQEPAVEDPPESGGTVVPSGAATQENLDELAARILSQITTPDMSQRQKARAIYDYVYSHIRYVGTSDKSTWIKGAYVGFTQGRGDCFNYFACSKELLTLAGIPNIDLSRVGGATDHYWQLVNVGDGWYHFDACPHPNGYPITSFLLTEAQVREYTVRCRSVRTNYYVYDYESCPVTVVGTPEEEIQQPEQPPAEQPSVEESPAERSAVEETTAEQPPAEETLGIGPEQPDNAPDRENGISSEEE